MTNWCYNEINIVGSDEEIDRFSYAVKGIDPFAFSALYPTPSSFKDDWYNWRIETWGTKWDPDVVDYYVTDGRLTIICYTACDPPLAFLENASSDFPELRFEISYHEPDTRIAGYAEFEKGCEVHRYDCKDEEVSAILSEHGYEEDTLIGERL